MAGRRLQRAGGPSPARHGGGWVAVGAGVLATATGALPAFLTGAVGVQLQEELAFDAAGLGAAVAVFFAVSALCSGPAGALAERIGPRRAIRLGTSSTALVLLAAAAVRSWAQLVAVLAVAGTVNALIQPAVNAVLMTAAARHRRGLAFGLKQAGVPTATLLGGLAVPLLALTAGWRATYVAGAVVAVIATAALPPTAGAAPARGRRPRLLSAPLLLLAAGMAIGSGIGSVLGVFVVPGAVAAGIAPRTAGWLLTAGSLTAISARVVVGWRADRRPGRLGTVAGLLLLGAVGLVLLSIPHPLVLIAAVPLAFGCGWGWNGLLHFTVAEANPEHAASVTGVTQAGVYTGATVAPALFGLAVSRLGVGPAWLLTAVAALVAAGLILLGRDAVRGREAGSRAGGTS